MKALTFYWQLAKLYFLMVLEQKLQSFLAMSYGNGMRFYGLVIKSLLNLTFRSSISTMMSFQN
jgi:hypothetical protein